MTDAEKVAHSVGSSQLAASKAFLRSAVARPLVSNQTWTRNRADGLWVAAAEPEAAQHALVNSYSRADIHRLAIFRPVPHAS